MTQGIYAIRHLASGARYVGSSVRIEDRFSCHRRLLKKGRHHARRLGFAWAKYGEDAFIFEIIEIIENRHNLIAIEQKHIDATAILLNGSKIAKLPEPRIGISLSDAHKAKLSAALKGRKFSSETRAKLSAKATGRKLTKADRLKMSAAKIGKKNPNLGHVSTPEQRALFAKNTKAMFADPERKAAWLEANKRGHAGKSWSVNRRAAYKRNKEAGL